MTNHQTFIYPTDTVWGIGGSLYSEISYSEIARIKKTSADKPLSILFSSLNQLHEYFIFPEHLSETWLCEFFSLETSLLVPLEWKKKEIPFWIFQGSAFVSVRCLELPTIKSLIEKVGSPITSTSLNLTGQAPISSFEEARLFHLQQCPQLEFFKGEGSDLSGRSSTMVSIDTAGVFTVLREGRYVSQIMALCGLPST